MSDENGFEPINVLLSREELLLVLDLLRAATIPGLDADPLGELDEAQRQLALIWAGRALRARGLAQVGEDGALEVHSALLTAVGVCAYANDAVFGFHWPAGGEAPVRYFGHIRGDDIAVHTRPEDVLHLFTLLPSKEKLLAQVLAFCEFEDVPEPRAFEMTVTNDVFVQAREMANDGDADGAAALLTGQGADGETAVAFTATLVNSPRITILQILKQDGDDAVQKSDFTIVQNDDYAWFIAPAQTEGEAKLLIRSTTKDEIEGVLAELL